MWMELECNWCGKEERERGGEGERKGVGREGGVKEGKGRKGGKGEGGKQFVTSMLCNNLGKKSSLWARRRWSSSVPAVEGAAPGGSPGEA